MPRKNTELIEGDCLEVLDTLYKKRGEIVDLVFCDPPYHLSNDGVTCQNGKMVGVNKVNGIAPLVSKIILNLIAPGSKNARSC